MNKRKFHAFRNKSLRNILVLFVLPSLLLSISLIFTYTLNFTNNKEQIKQNCTTSLKLYSQVCETEILSVIRSCSYLYHSQELIDFLQDNSDMTQSGTQYSISTSLMQFKNSNRIIDEIFILDKSSDHIITPDGLFEFSSYFENIYSYKNFDYDYWRQLMFFDHSPQHLLSPSKVTRSENETAVIPIVFRSLNGMRLSKYLVVNISLDSLLSSNTSYHLTDNSDVFVLNRYTGDVFGINNRYNLDNILNTPLYKNLFNAKASFNYKLNNNKVLVVSHSFYDNLLGYTYFATVPYSDIYHMQSYLLIYSGLIYIFFLTVAIYLSLKNSQKVITPIQHIAATLDPDFDKNPNIFEQINSSILHLQKKNDDISKTLPFAQEKYLINFLNSADLYIDESTRDMIKSSLPFKNDYFVSVVFQIFPKQDFFSAFSLTECDSIFSGLYTVIKSMFTERFDAFFLSSERETLYIIINADETFSVNSVEMLLDEICSLMQHDNIYLNLYTGVGNLHNGLNGLKQSHKEAIASIKSISFNIPKIILPGTSNNLLNDNDEANLYNALISLDINLARSLISDFVDNKQDAQTLKHLYTQILNLILRVMHIKNIVTHELFDEYISILSKSNADIYRYILTMLTNLDNYQRTYGNNQRDYEILEYIKHNFKDASISLEHLSALFNVSSNYLSQLIKRNLGIGFHEYLSNLRISYACELLLNSNMSIQEIYEKAGFSSKQTFFRIFKKNLGTTPNDYRSTNKSDSAKDAIN